MADADSKVRVVIEGDSSSLQDAAGQAEGAIKKINVSTADVEGAFDQAAKGGREYGTALKGVGVESLGSASGIGWFGNKVEETTEKAASNRREIRLMGNAIGRI